MSRFHETCSRRHAIVAGLGAIGGLSMGMPALLGTQSAEAASPGRAAVAGSVAAATRSFGFRLFAQLTAEQHGRNILISPSSIATVMAMIYNGTRGGTRQVMARVLGLQGAPVDQVNSAQASLIKTLMSLDPKIQLTVADALWARQGITFNPTFVHTVTSAYQARAATLDFGDPQASATINEWVRRTTHGKIDRIVGARLDRDAIMFLVNAVYFHAPWASPFDAALTRAGVFTRLDGSRTRLPMMTQTQHLTYYQGKGFQAVALPYGAGKVRMDIYLPDHDSSLAALQASLTARTWETWIAGFQPSYGTLTLPRFTVNYSATPNLNSALAGLGLGVVFDPMHADLTGIAAEPRPYLSEVKHRAMVEVDEAGTTAAAITSGQINATAAMLPRFTMVVDRPFLCAIHDSVTGSVLFLGSIVEPT